MGLLVGTNASVQVNWLYSYINAGVQLVGYYCAALLVDYRAIGRRRLTVFSFIMVTVDTPVLAVRLCPVNLFVLLALVKPVVQ